MCIIAIKPAGQKLPNEETIKRMFAKNPHGAGFMYTYNGRVEIRKGFMTYEGFAQALRNVHDRIGDKSPIVMHFRITTHGGTCPENTHPFPLSSDIADMKRLSTSAKIGIAHNGIINIKTRDNTVSDTQEYIADIIAPIYKHSHRFYKKQRYLDGIRDTINGSRMCFLTGDGKVYRVGKWVQDGGCWYSNDGFKKTEWTYTYTPYSWSGKSVTNDDYYSKHEADTKRKYESARLPWERSTWVEIMPLDETETYKDSDGFLWSGYALGIDRLGRMYELDYEDGIAYESHAYIRDNVTYDRESASYFMVA
jgi:hypothetical protein